MRQLKLSHLLPKGRAFQSAIDKPLSQFVAACDSALDDVREFFGNVYYDRFPSGTRFLYESETMLGISHQGTTAARRTRLAAAWQRIGGQSLYYIQAQLQAAGFDVYVFPFYTELADAWSIEIGDDDAEIGNNTAEIGGPVRSELPITIDPTTWLREGTGETWTITAGNANAVAGARDSSGSYQEIGNDDTEIGNDDAEIVGSNQYIVVAGARSVAKGYVLTNRTGAGDAEWGITDDSTKYSYYMYVGAETFGDFAEIATAQKQEFESLLLKLKPAHLHCGVFVRYI